MAFPPIEKGDLVVCLACKPTTLAARKLKLAPSPGCIYTVKNVVLTEKAEVGYALTFEEIEERADIGGLMCSILWRGENYQLVATPPVNVAAFIGRILCGFYGEPFGAKEITLYKDEYKDITAEADRRRKAKL